MSAMESANPINITVIDHVVFRVRALDVMTRFYCDVLGAKLERGPGELGLAQLRIGSSLLDLVSLDGKIGSQFDPPDHAAPTIDHVCFQVSPWNAQAVLDQLDAHGVAHEGVAQRYGASGQGESIYLSDPEGNRLELKAGA